MALSDTKVRTVKAKEKPFKIAEERGLFLLAQPTGGMKLSNLAFVLLAASFMNNALAENKFSGIYAGVHAGYVDGDDEGKERLNGVKTGWSFDNSPDSGLIGVLAGFNKVFENNVLWGLEADYEYRGSSDKSNEEFRNEADSDYPVKSKLRDAATVRARIGYIFNEGQTLAYVTGGYAGAEIKRTFDEYFPPTGSVSVSDWYHGWTLGLGAEHFVSDKLSVKAEYRYSDYGKERVNVDRPWTNAEYDKQEYDEQSIRIGLMYHY